MYKKPPKHVQRTRLAVLYSIMTLSVIAVVGVLVMIVANYRYNRATGTFEQSGLVQFASTPSAATVEIDDTTLTSRTSTKSSVRPGEHRFAVWREGYQTWISTTTIPSGSLVWLNYVRLVPKERPVEVLHEYKSVTAALPSPDNRAIIAQLDVTQPEFRRIDITRETVTGAMLALPEQAYKLTEDEEKNAIPVTYSLDSWDKSGRYMTVWRHAGEARELIVLNVEHPERSVNVSREFSIPVDAAVFSGRSGNVLYVRTDAAVRKIDISGGTVTRSLIDNVAKFNLQDDTVTYISRPDETTGIRAVGVYRDGDDAPTALKSIHNAKTPVAIASHSYYGETYTVISEGKKVAIYKGHYDKGLDGLKTVASYTLKSDIESGEFNDTGAQIVLRAGDVLASYDIDRRLLHRSDVAVGSARDMFWIDSMHLGSIANGELSMRDLDGTNSFTLNPALGDGKSAVLSRNGTYMYSFSAGKDGTVQLQRIRMILK
jgi:hypothetical protein